MAESETKTKPKIESTEQTTDVFEIPEKKEFDKEDYMALEPSDIKLFLSREIGRAMSSAITISNPSRAVELGKLFGSLADPRFSVLSHPAEIVKKDLLIFLEHCVKKYGLPVDWLKEMRMDKFRIYPNEEFSEYKDVMQIVSANILDQKYESLYPVFEENLSTIAHEPLKTNCVGMMISYTTSSDRKFLLGYDESTRMLFKNNNNDSNNVIIEESTEDRFVKNLIFNKNQMIANLQSWNPPDLESRILVLENSFNEMMKYGAINDNSGIKINTIMLADIEKNIKEKKIYNRNMIASQLTCALILDYMKGPMARALKQEEKNAFDDILNSCVISYCSIKNPLNTNEALNAINGLANINSPNVRQLENHFVQGLLYLRHGIAVSMAEIESAGTFRRVFVKSFSQLSKYLKNGVPAYNFIASLEPSANEEENMPVDANLVSGINEFYSQVEREGFIGLVLGSSALTYLNSAMVRDKSHKRGFIKVYESLIKKLDEERISAYKKLRDEFLVVRDKYKI